MRQYPKRKNYGSNVPLARELLHFIVDLYDDAVLRQLAQELEAMMHRSKVIRRTPPKNTITEDQKVRIRYLARKYPKMSQQEIATRVGTNAGRVSEVLHGID